MPNLSELQAFIGKAILAPSSHNTQPWLFEISHNTVRLFADRQRALPVNDPDDRELIISCGCALLNLRAAGAAAGYGSSGRTAPFTHDDDLLAEVLFSGPPDQQLAELASAIDDRHTSRARFEDHPLPATLTYALRSAALADGVALSSIDSPADRVAIAKLVAKADSIQWANPSWRRELAMWMHPRRQCDGLAVHALAAPLAKMIVRRFDLGGGIAAKDHELADHAPLLVVLSTHTDHVGDWLSAGQALQRVLLTATKVGFQAGYLNQPIEVAECRGQLADALQLSQHPQVLIRMGQPEAPLAKAARRPLSDVLLT